jgi:hypothetical protein
MNETTIPPNLLIKVSEGNADSIPSANAHNVKRENITETIRSLDL